jgi:BirA family biotin operon repressor/biotin-[acetyl-CoA-carboxylase] ligase
MSLGHTRIAHQLQTARYGRSLRVLDVTGSTNDDARADATLGADDGHVVVADRQSTGRGSQGRQWESPGGQDLYVSIVARPAVSMVTLPTLTLAVGLGVAGAVDELLGAQRSSVKWPNDVWVDRKKISGVLVEATTVGGETSAIVIGIGLNVNRTDFDAELAPNATSLRLASDRGAELDREHALCTLLAHVERMVDRWAIEGPSAIVPAVEARLALRGEPVTHDGLPATLLGLAASGALRLQTAAGAVERTSGRLLPA